MYRKQRQEQGFPASCGYYFGGSKLKIHRWVIVYFSGGTYLPGPLHISRCVVIARKKNEILHNKTKKNIHYWHNKV